MIDETFVYSLLLIQVNVDIFFSDATNNLAFKRSKEIYCFLKSLKYSGNDSLSCYVNY